MQGMKMAISIPSPHSTISRVWLLLAALEGSSLDNLARRLSCQPQNPAASFHVEAKRRRHSDLTQRLTDCFIK